MRATKAEGGWGVVCTEYCIIHPSADDTSFPYATLWDAEDVKAHALMTEAVHAHGSLAGVELAHGGHQNNNLLSRDAPLSPSGAPAYFLNPRQTKAMDRADIKALREWHRAAARRALEAQFDIVYVYAGHGYLPAQFLSREYNQRCDQYGGPLENRARLLRELLDDTIDTIAGRAAVAVRLTVDDLSGDNGLTSDEEGRAVVEMLAELPDLWDVQVGNIGDKDSASARFATEGWQEPYIAFVKRVTSKPVVGVGRFTSPDTMASQVKRGLLDFVGAARPSIADPFLPIKIKEGREDEIRECIGCNICRSSNNQGAPLRCTQNPTMGEEWRRGWHPERVPPKGSSAKVLVIGGGPAGLECARTLGERGYETTLAEARKMLGGRLIQESKLPGLASWARVIDYRVNALNKMPNVQVYLDSRMTSSVLQDGDFDHVVVATGAEWRRDGAGHHRYQPAPGAGEVPLLTPAEVMAGAEVKSPVVIVDDDHYYMGGCLAEKLAAEGHSVTLATPASVACSWTHNTNEHDRIQANLLSLGVELITEHGLVKVAEKEVILGCIYTARTKKLEYCSLVLVGARSPQDGLYRELVSDNANLENWGIKSISRIGDCLAPGAIVHAIYSGHRFARELDSPAMQDVGFLRERAQVDRDVFLKQMGSVA